MTTQVSGTTKTYVEVLYHSILFSENQVEEVSYRDPNAIATKYKNAFGFRFFDQERTNVKIGGKDQTVYGERKHESQWYYPGGQVFTVEDVEKLKPKKDFEILISNMRGNGYKKVVKTRHGGFVPFSSRDEII